jgi:hypothetical protein
MQHFSPGSSPGLFIYRKHVESLLHSCPMQSACPQLN